MFDMDELQEIPSDSDDESKDRTRGLHGKIARMKELCPEDEDDILSPIGSPREFSHLGGRGKFLELKKKLEADQANRAIVLSDESIQPIIQEDVEALLESFKHEREAKEASRSMSIRNDNHPKFVEMYQQIVDRDHKILDLEKRIMELDRHVIDLNDTVKQRDKLIGTKNEAVAVVQSKFKRELEDSENEMRKTQKTLFEMEKNFGSAQEMWKSEKERLNAEIESNLKRFKNIEESNKKLESTRFELTTKLAELQETLVLQQGDKEKIRKLEEELQSKNSTRIEDEEKILDLTDKLEKANGQLSKMKAQFVAKLKALKEQQVDTNQDLVKELENKVAELEEEKGNLLLNLVDYEELQASNKALKEKINDLENEAAVIDESNNQLNVSILEMAKEKQTLDEESKSKEAKEYELSSKIEELEVSIDLQTMENAEKIKALEEEIQRLINEKKEEENKAIDLAEKLEKSNGQLVKMKAQFQAKLKALKEKQIDTANVEGMKELENRLAELEEEKGNLLLNLVDFEEQLAANTKLKEKIMEIEEQSIAFAADAAVIYQSNNELNENIAEMMKEKETMNEEFEEVEQKLSTKIQELQYLLTQKQNENDEKTKIIEELEKRKPVEFELNKPSEPSEDQNKILDLTEKLDKANSQLVKMKAQFQAKLRALREKQVDTPNQDTIRELENRLAVLEDEKGNLLLRLVDFEEQEEKNLSTLSNHEAILQEKEAEKMRIEDELNQLAAALGQKNSEVESLMKNVSELQSSLESRISELTQSVGLKDEEIAKAISQYDMFYAEAQDRILYLESQLSRAEDSTAVKLNELTTELNMVQSQKTDLEEMVNQLQKTMSEKEDSIVNLSEQINVYSAQMNDEKQNEFNFQELINKSEASLNEKLNEILVLNNKIFGLEEELSHKDLNEEAQKELIAQLKSSLFENEAKITSLNDKMDEMEEELRTKETSESALKDSVFQLKSTLFENENRFSPLNERIQELEGALRIKTEIEESFNAQVLELTSCLSEKEARMALLNEKVEEVSKELKAKDQSQSSLEEMITELQDYLAQKDQAISHLSARIEQFTNELTNKERSEEALKNEIANLGKVRGDLMSEVSKLEKSIEEKEEELSRRREDADCLQSEQMNEMNELKKKISSLMDQFNDVENEMGSLNERLKDSEQVRGSLEEKLRSYDTNENLVFEKNEEILHLQEKLKETMEKHQLELETNFVKYSDEMELVYEQLGQKAEETNNLQFQIRSMEGREAELSQMEQKLIELQEQLNGSNAQIGSLKESLRISEKEMEAVNEFATRTNDELRMQHEIQAAEYEGKIREFEQMTKELQRRIDESGEKLKEVYSRNETLVKENKGLKEENETLRQELLNCAQPSAPNLSSIEEPFTITSSKGDNLAQMENPFANSNSSQSFLGDNFGQMDPIPMIPMYNVQTGGFSSGIPPLLSSGPVGGTEPTDTIDLENGKDDRIYELEVQLAELNITIEDLQSQLQEYSEMKAGVEILSFQNEELKQENVALRGEIERRQREESLKSHVPSPLPQIPSPTPTMPGEPVVEDLVLKSTAYETTELATKQAGEIRELKVKNGKMIQKFKQLKDKYDQLLKENGSLKDKKEFSLEGAIENELMGQVKEKEALLEEKEKILSETEKERARLSQKADVLARANDRFTEMKENQDRMMEQLYSERRSLEDEISGLKWKLEEILSGAHVVSDEVDSSSAPQQIITTLANEETEKTREEDGLKMMSLEKEVHSLRHHNALLSEELLSLQDEIGKLSEELNASVSGLPEDMKNHMEKEREEKCILERKVDLLQEKISEIEVSEIKSFEEALMLKSWTRQLELDNIKYQKELQQVYSSLNEGEVNHIKMKALQEEVFRLVGTVQDRDRRCEELTAEITRLLEERDTLQLKLSNVLKHNVSLHEEMNKGKEMPSAGAPTFDHEDLRKKLAELEESNYSMVLDLRREREARRVVQEQLFFSQTTRAYRLERERQRSPTSPSAPGSLPPTPSPFPLGPQPTQWGTSRPHSPMPNIPSVPYEIDDESDEGRNSPQKVSLTPPPPTVVHI